MHNVSVSFYAVLSLVQTCETTQIKILGSPSRQRAPACCPFTAPNTQHPSPHRPQPPAATNLFSRSCCHLHNKWNISGITCSVTFGDWLFPLSILPLRPIPVLACIHSLPLCCTEFHNVGTPQLVYPLT